MAGIKGDLNSLVFDWHFLGIQISKSFSLCKQLILIFLFLSMLLVEWFIIRLALVSLAFAGSIGMTFIILACALPDYNLWWPFFVVLFYVLAPIPTLMARRYTETQGSSNSCLEAGIFITMGLVVSSFALPIVLARVPIIKWGACYFTLAGNVVVYITLLGFFLTFDQDDSDYNMW